MPFISGDAVTLPWWWVRIVMMEERIQNIQKATATDPDEMVAPKELWLTGREDELEGWFKGRQSPDDPNSVLR